MDNPLHRKSRLLVFDFADLSKAWAFGSNLQDLDTVLKKFNITEIFVNHLIHFNFPLMAQWLIDCKIPYTIFMHDYYCICPNVHLQHCHLQFCELSKVHGLCQFYLRGIPIAQWRKYWHLLMSTAAKIITPSTYAAKVVKSVYPNLKIEVQPHILTSNLSRTFKKEFALRKKLRITFLGEMNEHKGEEYLLKCNELLLTEKLPIEFVVLGSFGDDVLAGTKKGLIFAGAYNVNDVSKKLAEYETGIVAVLSKTAETYCYTASEAILSGYPVLALNIGAHAARISKYHCGWVIPFKTEDHGLTHLKSFLRLFSTMEFRSDILQKAANTVAFKNGME